MNDYKYNIIIEGMVDMHKSKIEQCNEVIKILKQHY